MFKNILISFMLIIPLWGVAQNCEEMFIKRITKEYASIHKSFVKISSEVLRKYDVNMCKNDTLKVIFIPNLLVKSKRKLKKNIDKENFFCYLPDVTIFEFEESIVVQDSILGYILHSFDEKLCFDTIYPYKNGLDLVSKRIIEIAPDIVFRIYYIGGYWMIKNNELEVLTFEEKTQELKLYDARDYINEISELEFEKLNGLRKFDILSY